MVNYGNISTHGFINKTSALINKSSFHVDATMRHSSNSGWPATIWVAIGAIIAAIVTVLITKQIKISEFRQAWINDLRDDIAECISKADEWIDIWVVHNSNLSNEEKASSAIRLDEIKYGSFEILRRIELRFKPDDEQGNLLIKNLYSLFDPSKLSSPIKEGPKVVWTRLAHDTVLHARYILKEEWEVTKNPFHIKN